MHSLNAPALTVYRAARPVLMQTRMQPYSPIDSELIGCIEWIAVFTSIFCEILCFREPLKKHHFQIKKRN